jgi:undecaprenyl-diphosphatase
LHIDTTIVGYIAHHRSDRIVAAMRDVSMLGNVGFLAGMVLLGGLLLRRQTGSWVPLLVLAAAGLGAATIGVTTKALLWRTRPPAAWMAAQASGWAFPSNHATCATAVYGALGYLLAVTRDTWLARIPIWTAAVFSSLMIGISRVYLGVHWPTDVIGGWILAITWLLILLGVVVPHTWKRWQRPCRRVRHSQHPEELHPSSSTSADA